MLTLSGQRHRLRMNGEVGRPCQNRALEHSVELRAGLQPLQSLAR